MPTSPQIETFLPSVPRQAPNVEIRKFTKPQNKREVTLLAAVTANGTGAAYNVGEGYAFTFFITGVGAGGTVVIEAQDGNGNWATWKTFTVSANATDLYEALSAQRMIRAKVINYASGSITVRAIVVNIHAIEIADVPATIDWSNVTNIPSAVTDPTLLEIDIVVPMIQVGDLAVNQLLGYYKPTAAVLVKGIDYNLGDAPAGSSLTIDVTKNGTAQTKTVTITAGTYAGQGIFGTPVSLAAGDVMRVKVTAVGSTAPGANLTANLIVGAP
jgi:predicted RNA-binding protein with TRAM domain